MLRLKHRVLSLIGAAVLLGGCAAMATVTAAQAGRTVAVKSGERFQIVLDANPTTGYNWVFSFSVPDAFSVVSDEYRPNDPERCGSPGLRLVTFEARRPGAAQITARYFRAWEKFDPAIDRQLRFDIAVGH